jgi:hypothetical protein
MTVEMTPDEIIDLFLGLDVEVLEFVHCSELLDIETVRKDSVCLSATSNARGSMVDSGTYQAFA